MYPTARRAAASAGYISDTSSTTSSSDDDDSDIEADREVRDEEEQVLKEQYLGFSNNVLASLLSPNRELCDQPFELVVNHLAMIGHPVWLGDDAARGAGGPAPEFGGSTNYDYTVADEEEERGRTKRRQAEHDAFLLNPEGRYGSVSSEASNSGSSREPSPVPPPITPLTPSSLLLQPSVTSSQHSHNSLHGSGRLISFNLVCIIDTPPDSHLSSHLEGYYKDIIVPMTANIKTLEMREKWLGRETAKLRRASENYVEKGMRPFFEGQAAT